MLTVFLSDHDARTIGIVCGVAALIALAFFLWGIIATVKELKCCTELVPAKCCKEEKRWRHNGQGDGMHTSHDVYYLAYLEYEYNGQTYQTAITEEPADDPGNRTDTTFDILIDPNDPHRIRRPEQKYSWVSAVLLAVFTLAFGAVSVWLLFFYR